MPERHLPVRIAVLSVVVACNSPAVDRLRSPTPITSEGAIARCPVGDGVNVAVYGFLVREMAERTTGSREATRAALAEEANKLADPSLKPPRASIVESELSHALTTLCVGTPGCVTAAIYDRHGLAIALSSQHAKVAPYGFGDDQRWNTLTAQSSADAGGDFELACEEAKTAGLPCDGHHRLVTFPVFAEGALRGLASCIVEARPRT